MVRDAIPKAPEIIKRLENPCAGEGTVRLENLTKVRTPKLFIALREDTSPKPPVQLRHDPAVIWHIAMASEIRPDFQQHIGQWVLQGGTWVQFEPGGSIGGSQLRTDAVAQRCFQPLQGGVKRL